LPLSLDCVSKLFDVLLPPPMTLKCFALVITWEDIRCFLSRRLRHAFRFVSTSRDCSAPETLLSFGLTYRELSVEQLANDLGTFLCALTVTHLVLHEGRFPSAVPIISGSLRP